MTADTLTPNGAPVVLPLPTEGTDQGVFYEGSNYAVVPGLDEIVTVYVAHDPFGGAGLGPLPIREWNRTAPSRL